MNVMKRLAAMLFCLLSVYIIQAEDWEEDYVYRGDGLWTIGISIE